MRDAIFQDVPEQERKTMLADNAYGHEEMTYHLEMDKDEISILKTEYTQKAIDLARLEEKKKEFMTDHNAEVKPLKEQMSDSLGQIRSRSREVTEKVYLIDDQDSGVMMYYNSKGKEVMQRPLRQDERQLRLTSNHKAI